METKTRATSVEGCLVVTLEEGAQVDEVRHAILMIRGVESVYLVPSAGVKSDHNHDK